MKAKTKNLKATNDCAGQSERSSAETEALEWRPNRGPPVGNLPRRRPSSGQSHDEERARRNERGD